MATQQDCPHSNTVWVGWQKGRYVAAWKCLACGELLYPKEED